MTKETNVPITLSNDGGPDIRFKGRHIASATSKRAYNDGGRWTELHLYRTAGGQYVAHEQGITCWEGEANRYKAKVCATADEVVDFFGYGWVAKDLYYEADIDYAVDVD